MFFTGAISGDQDGLAETRPIKGTLPRGTTTQDDRALKQRLLASEKIGRKT